jgi:SAM-dependent methyltransferase
MSTDLNLIRRGLPKSYAPTSTRRMASRWRRAPTNARRMASRWRRLRAARRDYSAKSPGLNTTISAYDDMFDWTDPGGYFATGHWAARKIKESVTQFGVAEPRHILDLPCGYGRVLRYLQLFWPNAEIVAGELTPGAVEFCHNVFGAVPLQSKDPLWEVELGGPYDLIWCGSLLTHFDEEYWHATLRHFGGALNRPGLLVFTTHGRPPYEVL